jgi:hypothetical protein
MKTVLWIRAILFTLLVPGSVMVWIPWLLHEGRWSAHPATPLGWILVGAGAMFYLLSMLKFLAAGGRRE